MGNGKTPKKSKESLVEDDKEQLLNPWMHWWWSFWWLRQGRNSLHRGSLCQGCFGLKGSRNHKLGAAPFLNRPWWQTGGGGPHKSLGSPAVIQRELDIYTIWCYNCLFHLFCPLFLSRRQNAFEPGSCGIIISATALFKGDVNLTTRKDILEKAVSFIHE